MGRVALAASIGGLVLAMVGIVLLTGMLSGGEHRGSPGEGNVWVYEYFDKVAGTRFTVAVFLGRGEGGYIVSGMNRTTLFYVNDSLAVQVDGGGVTQVLVGDKYLVIAGGVAVEPASRAGISAQRLYSQFASLVNRSGIIVPIVPYQFTPPAEGCRSVNSTLVIGGIPVSEVVEVCVDGGVVTRIVGKSLEVRLIDSAKSGPGLVSFAQLINGIISANISVPDLGLATGAPRYAAVVVRGADPRAPTIIESVINGSAKPDYYIYGDPLRAVDSLVHFKWGSGDLVVIEFLDPRCPYCAKLNHMLGNLAIRLARDATYIAVLTPTASSHICSQPSEACAESASVWAHWTSIAESGGDVISAIHRFYVTAAESGFDAAASTINTTVTPGEAYELFSDATSSLLGALRSTWLGVVVGRPVTPVLIVLLPVSR